MNLFKKIVLLLFFYVLINSQPSNNQANPSLSKIIEVSPSALDVIIHSFDNAVIYFHRADTQAQLNQALQRFEIVKDQIRTQFPSDHALFGYVNMTEDYSHRLQRFGNKEGFKILNRFIPHEKFQDRQEGSLLLSAYQTIAHPRLPLKYASEVLNSNLFEYNLLFKFTSSQKLTEYNQIYEKIKFYIEELFVGPYAVPAANKEKDEIVLLKGEQVVKIYNFINLTISEIANDLVQEVNIDTLPLLSTLNSNNIHRIFGGSVSDQILLLYKDSINEDILTNVKETFKKAALFNKQQQLAYERVIFAVINEQFFEEQFNEQSSTIFMQAGDSADYAMVFTKTDYDRFNLKKYVLKDESKLSVQKIISFIEDVRMKRLEPQYKSQPVPDQSQNNRTLRTIVGSSFISEVYGKPDQSIIILFIDSKDKQSYIDTKNQLQSFAEKHKQEFEGVLTFGIFDLAKNEHKLLYLKQAPQIVLFDKANKKQTKYFKMGQGVSVQLLQKWVASQLSSSSLYKLVDEM